MFRGLTHRSIVCENVIIRDSTSNFVFLIGTLLASTEARRAFSRNRLKINQHKKLVFLIVLKPSAIRP